MKTRIIQYKTSLFYGLAVLSFLLPVSVIQAQNEIGINTASPKSDFEINGSFAKKVTVVTTNTTLDETHSIVICNNAGTAMTITLPTATTCAGRVYTIKKGTSTTDITIATSSSQTIDGASSLVLSDQYVTETLISNGTEWKINNKHVAVFPLGDISFFNATTTSDIVINTSSDGSTFMSPLAPVTTFTGRAGGEFSNGGSDNGRLYYNGKNTKTFHIAGTITGHTNSASNCVLGIALNGVVQPASKVLNRFSAASDNQSTAFHLMIDMAPGNYLQIYVGNVGGTSDFHIHSLNLFALGMD